MPTPDTSQRYEVLTSLARGGMAEVLLARQRAAGVFERYVVLKATLPHLRDDAQFVSSFLAEARLAAQLQHPNIAQIYDIAQMEGRPCIVMEWLRGRDLRAIMQRLSMEDAAVDPPIAARILLGAASALSYAHRARDARGRALGIVHRDVSPHNIFVTRDGGVKLIDFGVAKSEYQIGRTEGGVLKGKLAYMAPEQAGGRPVDARSDLWSLGVVAWECLTGERLFGGATPLETMMSVSEDPIRPASSVRAGVDPDLDAIVLSLLEREPSARIDDAREVERRLEAWGRRRPLASATELGEWLDTLFPEVEDEARLTGSSTTDVELRSVTPMADEPTLVGPDDATIAEQGASGRATQRGKTVAVALVAVLAIGGAAAAWALVSRSESRSSSTDPPRVVAASERPGPVAAPSARPTVTLRVAGLPDDAALYVGARRVEGAEIELDVGGRHEVVIRRADGTLLYETALTAESDVTIPLVAPTAPREARPADTRRQKRRVRARTTDGSGVGMGIDWDYE